MRRVRLLNSVDSPGNSGPFNGQYALQRLLRNQIAAGLDWLSIGGEPAGDELPWFWNWDQRTLTVKWAEAGRPFVTGPNQLVAWSGAPRADTLDSAILDAQSCQLIFTESAWYEELIRAHRGHLNQAPIVVWPYPIDPQPPGPARRAKYDLLLYNKSGYRPRMLEELVDRFPRSIVLHYGQYRRQDLFEAAGLSRCCAYLSDDDRGPLALAEILLAGCPAVGLPRGAPWLDDSRLGRLADRFDVRVWIELIESCHALNRDDVSAHAKLRFDSVQTIRTVLTALDIARAIT